MALALVDGYELSVKLSYGIKNWMVYCDRLDIHAVGKTLEEALVHFSDQVDYFYQHYNSLSNEKCTNRALELKYQYKTMFVEKVGG